MSDGKTKAIESIEKCLEKLSVEDQKEVKRILYGKELRYVNMNIS